ncbi:uncharacterized protein LOC126618548 [Malus sylvestris]|uniref:uncharacterized protein LOC126618548 n=1 Tax=Malus sylvestris TaxID=3752 RepID=UPI0021ACBD30|nr:uncharacterized protein LOC126618548 [Malus sylvestris]
MNCRSSPDALSVLSRRSLPLTLALSSESEDIRLPLEQKVIKRMNFGVIPIGDVRVPFKMIVSKFQIFLPSHLTVVMKLRPSAQLSQIDVYGRFEYFGGQHGIF